jgi:hypothetical protein
LVLEQQLFVAALEVPQGRMPGRQEVLDQETYMKKHYRLFCYLFVDFKPNSLQAIVLVTERIAVPWTELARC